MVSRSYVLILVLMSHAFAPVLADSSSPRLAAYYDLFLALCDDSVYEWRSTDRPRKTIVGATRVGVGKHNRYALTNTHLLVAWRDDPGKLIELMDDVHSFHAGRTSLLVVRRNRSLWQFETKSVLGFGEDVAKDPIKIADNVRTASVGDSANYYVTHDGALRVRGRAHRGQYGDGKLTATENFVQTAEDVVQVVSHTGHALILKRDGSVWGTGGNIYGPLSRHGYGDKATRWGRIFDNATAIATGSSHSLAVRRDRGLWAWGRGDGLEPKKIMADVSAVAAGNKHSIALRRGVLWQWQPGAAPRQLMHCAE